MNWLRRMMYGRNGADQLSLALLILSTVLALLANILRFSPLALLYYLALALCLFRMFSRNIYKRQKENMWFMGKLNAVRSKCKLYIRMIKEIRTHRYLRCPNCKQRLRVPRGKGKINVTCSKCRQSFQKKV